MRALWALVRRFWLSITIGIVIILGLAIWIHFNKETNCVAGWLFDFLQQWAIVLGAAVTLLLALIAVLNISDTRHFRYAESIAKYLDEVCSWLTETKRALYLPKWGHQEAARYQLRDKLENVAVRSEFVKGDAERLARSLPKGQASEAGHHLASKVSDVITHLDQFIVALRKTTVADSESLRGPWKELGNEFDTVIEVASQVRKLFG